MRRALDDERKAPHQVNCLGFSQQKFFDLESKIQVL